MSKKTIVSAQVILRPASGKAIDGRVAITASNLAEFAPAPTVVSWVAEKFHSTGFEVGAMVGISFSVTGALRAFEDFFRVQIRLGEDNAYEFVINRKNIGHELSGDDLPEALRKFVHAVVFPLPPDFGPTEFQH